jgi:hypothetical protein
MFFKEEDIQPVVDVVTQTLGQQGIMMEGKSVTKNVILGSREFGKMWYGDIDGNLEYINNICAVMSQRTSQKILVVSDTF